MINGVHEIPKAITILAQIPLTLILRTFFRMIDKSRVTFNPKIMAGQACIRGMRIPVSLIINLVANGKPRAEIMAEYPDLEDDDISAALLYAAWLTQDRFVNFEQAS
jgi:uncharacterized protein (DUF433 family)